MKHIALALTGLLGLATLVPAAASLTLTPLGTLKTGTFAAEDPRSAEINAYDPAGQRAFVVNPAGGRIDILDLSDPAAPVAATPASLDIVGECEGVLGAAGCPVEVGSEPNGVAISGHLLAVAVANATRTDNGHAVFFELQGTAKPVFLAAVEVGALPDMITFTEDGTYALTANEGEPNPDYTIDPPGSVSIIEVATVSTPGSARTVGFDRFDEPGQREKIESEGVRIFGPGATVAQDLEPEYIATDRNKAYVTLQENNALAIINIDEATVEKIVGLGLKDHSLLENALDVRDNDGVATILPKSVFGMYQPDAIAAFRDHGKTYLVMANEGDAREYVGSPGFVEAFRIGTVVANPPVLDPTVFPNAAALKTNGQLARLTVSRASGDTDGDGDYDRLDVFGARSISIRDHKGELIWDSQNVLERLSRDQDIDNPAATPLFSKTLFNVSNSNSSRDNRSDDKSIEPEAVVLGVVNGIRYAFIGLERDGGIAVFDLTNPEAPAFVTYANNRKFKSASGTFLACSNTVDCGDLGPEGLTFVPASQSPNGQALLIVSNEVSGTNTIWTIE
jgi:DNA-binding beta-propeller fold protein YncE